jgi:AcrR family transcriptional regulator
VSAHSSEGRALRRQRQDGARSRAAILEAAARLATVEGLEGLSIARLAQHVGMSKSGLFAHFGSKEELQLATIQTAAEIYNAEVVAPALGETSGLERLEALCERFLSHVERNVFPGGCFFASATAELDTRPGPVRDRAAAMVRDWMELLTRTVSDAQAEGDIDPAEDPAQLTFELHALLLLGNAQYVISGDHTGVNRARAGVERRLALARTEPAPVTTAAARSRRRAGSPPTPRRARR